MADQSGRRGGVQVRQIAPRLKTQPIEHRGPCAACGKDEWRFYATSWRCVHCERRRWKEQNPPAKERARALKRKYGMTVEDFDALLLEQQGRCDICGDPMTGKLEPMIDHCHSSLKIRALLCAGCNTLLGGAQDDPQRLVAALDYLVRQHPERFHV